MASSIKFDDEQCQLETVIDALNLHRTTVRRLMLHQFLTDESFHTILSFLHRHSVVCNVQALNVASNPLLAPASIVRLADNIHANTLTLKELDLSNNPQSITAESLDALQRGLSVSLMKRLNLSSNALHRRDVCPTLERLIRNNKTIEQLDLSHNHFGARHIHTISPGLSHNRNINRLDLSNNPLKDVGMKRLMTPTICDSLTSLSLSLTHFSKVGASHIKDCLLRNRTIQALDLSKNDISFDGAESIGSILRYNYTLRELNLSQNNMGNDGMEAIIRGFLDNESTRLTHLDVSSNGLTNADIIGEMIRRSVLVDLRLRDNAIVDMHPLATAVHADVSLKILDVSQNKMTDPSCWMELIYHGSYSLSYFLYNHNHMDDLQAERLEAAICFLNNEKTWLAKILHQIETRPRVSLDLRGYTYGDEEIVRIAQAIERHKPSVVRASFIGIRDRSFCFLGRRVFRNWTANILQFNLHDCQHLGGEGWDELTQAIGDQRCPLETLSLIRCHLRRPQSLATALLQNKSLKHLCLEVNDIGSADAKAILAAALNHPCLGYLNLANNNLTDEVLAGMAPIQRLRTLKLHNNNLTDIGALTIAQAVMHCRTLRWLTLKGNHITKKGIDGLTIFLNGDHILDCND